MTGRIIKAISGFYYVYAEDGNVYECKARGNFRRQGITLLVGDFAEITLSDSSYGVVEEIKPRKNELYRPLIANIDKLFIVSSYSTPSPDLLMIDRLTALAVYHNIEPIIVFNKSDMGDFEEYLKIYKKTGFKVYAVSATERVGVDPLFNELKNCVSAFSGNSGVGKSSLLNAFFGETLNLQTGDVSEKLGRGRHTTRHTELYPHKYGGFVADTPGFSSNENEKKDYNFKEHLTECFPDLKRFSTECKFTSCTHTCEKGCGVLDAVKSKKIAKSRHESYSAIFKELKDLKEWNGKKA